MNRFSRKSLQVALAAAVVSFLVVGATAVDAAPDRPKKHFHAKLDATQETPIIASLATGEFDATLNADGDELSFELSWEGLEGGLPAAAHVHLGQPGVPGGVMFFLCGGGGKPACPAATRGTVEGTVTAANIVGVPAQGLPAGDFAEALRLMSLKEATYANIHTTSFPTGEIRGVIKN